MEFGILGSLHVSAGGTTVEIRPGHPRTLLVALLLRVGETVTRDALLEMLWGDEQPQNPVNALQVQVSYLRKALSSAEPGGAQLIETRPGGYALAVPPGRVDVDRFESLVREAESTRVDGSSNARARALGQLDAALALWRGAALTDVQDQAFAVGEITRLDEARWAAIETRNDLLLELGRHRELIGELTRVVKQHSLRERFHEQLMLALYRCGRQADALRACEEARTILLEELGLELGPGLRRLERAILEQDPSLDWIASATPEMAVARVSASTLPVPLTALIGREAELDRANHLLDANRIITLTGPGGAGKSRLALEIAHRRVARHEVWFVDLGSVSDGQRVAAAVATGIGVPSTPDEDTGVAVAQALSRERGLFVLDTCEHVLSSAAEIAIEILRVCPEIRILATSRRPLGITGEIAWPVPPLALPPPPERMLASDVAMYAATALFAERAAAVRPGFEVTDSTAADIAAICLGLDGLPLAIELAAARSDVLTPAAINARLHNRFELLVGGGREAAARQQTLRSAIDWSFELLDDTQRRFFACLGVFPSSFDFDAAVAVAGVGLDDPLALLSALVRSSMVSVAGDDHFRLLDTLRVYAAEVLDGTDYETRRAHALHFTRVAEAAEQQVIGTDQVSWLARVRADVPNFRTAFEWSVTNGEEELAARLAGALSWFWTLDGMLTEAVEYLERVAPLPSVPPLVRSKALSGIALLAASLGRLAQARSAAIESVSLGSETGDAFAHAFALNALAVAEWARGDLEASAAAHDEAIARLRGTDNPWVLGVCLSLRARTALETGDPAGQRLAEEALPVARASGDRHVIGLALLQLAQLRLAEGEVDAAVEAAGECLRLQEEIAYTEGTVAALHVLARSVESAGNDERARQLNLRALALADRIGHTAAMCEALEGLAALAAKTGDLDNAWNLLKAADFERVTHDLPLHVRDHEALEELRSSVEKQLDREPAPNMSSHEISTAAIIDRLLQQQ